MYKRNIHLEQDEKNKNKKKNKENKQHPPKAPNIGILII